MLTVRRVRKAAGKRVSRTRVKVLTLLGAGKSRHCPACNSDVVGFFRYGKTKEWGCPECGAAPRQRLMHALLDAGMLEVSAGAAVLHCAPNENRLVERFRGPASEYIPADIDPAKYDIPGIQRVDLMAMEDRNRFDRIYASHVLEHVPDDSVALGNLHRALKPGGEAWLLVPIWEKPTEDGPADLDPRERERRYGQWDHVRQYGLDFANRIEAVGFSVEVLDGSLLAPPLVQRMGLGDRVFRARRDN